MPGMSSYDIPSDSDIESVLSSEHLLSARSHCFVLFYSFWNSMSLCSLGRSGWHYIDQAGPNETSRNEWQF